MERNRKDYGEGVRQTARHVIGSGLRWVRAETRAETGVKYRVT